MQGTCFFSLYDALLWSSEVLFTKKESHFNNESRQNTQKCLYRNLENGLMLLFFVVSTE